MLPLQQRTDLDENCQGQQANAIVSKIPVGPPMAAPLLWRRPPGLPRPRRRLPRRRRCGELRGSKLVAQPSLGAGGEDQRQQHRQQQLREGEHALAVAGRHIFVVCCCCCSCAWRGCSGAAGGRLLPAGNQSRAKAEDARPLAAAAAARGCCKESFERHRQPGSQPDECATVELPVRRGTARRQEPARSRRGWVSLRGWVQATHTWIFPRKLATRKAPV